MARSGKSNLRPSGRVVDLLRDGKKTVLASALLLVMAFMWIRVLTGRQPKPAGADSGPAPETPAAKKTVARNQFVELPRMPGRHDAIYQDVFNIQNRACFSPVVSVPDPGTNAEVPVVPPHRDEEVIQQAAGTLTLEAVLRNNRPQAFVNDRLLAVGDTFLVEHSAGPLLFEVLQIQEDSVLVECNDIQVTLKLTSPLEVRKQSDDSQKMRVPGPKGPGE